MHNFISKSCNASLSTMFQRGQLGYGQETIKITRIDPCTNLRALSCIFSIFVILPNLQKCQTTLQN